MTHNASCANAKLHKCNCVGCGGAQHGWQGHLDLARQSHAGMRKEFRARVNERWGQNRPGSPKARLTRDRRAAAADSAIIDLVDWLACHPQQIELVQSIGDLLAKDVAEHLERSLGSAKWKHARRSFLDHFWCDLLAALAAAIARFNAITDRIPEYAERMILESRALDQRTKIDEVLVRLATQAVWKLIKRLPPFGQVEEFHRAIRILAILLCPAPENHPAVYHHCVVPLVGEGARELISTETKRRLEEIFPDNWPDMVRRRLSGREPPEPSDPSPR